MDQARWADDDALLADLASALDPGPAHSDAVAAGRGALPWRRPDRQVLTLEHDSLLEEPVGRSHLGARRRLVFVRDDVAVELEVLPRGLEGRIRPGCAAHVVLQSQAADIAEVTSDRDGRFSVAVEGLTDPLVRLLCTTTARRLVTDWVRLSR